MNAKDFRLHYTLSLLAMTFGVILFVAAIIMMIFSSFDQVSQISNSHSSVSDIDSFWKLVLSLFKNGILVLLSVGIVFGGVVWNLIIAYLRSARQNNSLKLFWIVLGGWAIQILLPLLGLFIGLFLQVWAWRLGSEPDRV